MLNIHKKKKLLTDCEITWFLLKSLQWLNAKNYLCCSIGRPKYERVMAGALKPDIFMGAQAQEHRGLLNIKYPIEVNIRGNFVKYINC